VFHDKPHHRHRIIQTMRMMTDTRFMDDLTGALQRAVALFDDGGVLRHRHHVIGVADYMDKRNACLGQGAEHVDGIAEVRECVGFGGKLVVFHQRRPIPWAALSFATGPTPEIAHRRISMDHRNLVGVLGSKAVSVETAPTDADERRLQRQSLRHQRRMERHEIFHRRRTAESISDRNVRVMETGGEQLRCGAAFGKRIGELHAP